MFEPFPLQFRRWILRIQHGMPGLACAEARTQDFWLCSLMATRSGGIHRILTRKPKVRSHSPSYKLDHRPGLGMKAKIWRENDRGKLAVTSFLLSIGGGPTIYD